MGNREFDMEAMSSDASMSDSESVRSSRRRSLLARREEVAEWKSVRRE